MEEKSGIKSFKDLLVWQKSYDLVKEIYKISAKLPTSEQFGLQSQIRRCAISVPSNIAEGKNRKTTKDFLQFLRIAYGSLSELETQVLLMKDLYLVDISQTLPLVDEVSRMLRSLIYILQQKTNH